MIELELIHKATIKFFRVDPVKKSRQDNYVLARAAFYYYAEKYTIYGRAVIGEYVNKDHAAVYHSEKNLEVYKKFKLGFESSFNAMGEYIKESYAEMLSGDFIEKDRDKVEIMLLKKQLSESDKKIKIQESKLKGLRRGLNKNIINMLETLNEEELQVFINTRLNPYMRMYNSAKRKLAV